MPTSRTIPVRAGVSLPENFGKNRQERDAEQRADRVADQVGDEALRATRGFRTSRPEASSRLPKLPRTLRPRARTRTDAPGHHKSAVGRQSTLRGLAKILRSEDDAGSGAARHRPCGGRAAHVPGVINARSASPHAFDRGCRPAVRRVGRPAAAQWQIESKDGTTNLKIGFLAQPQLEIVDTPDGTGQSKNIYLRRIRIMFGGKITDRWTFFFETDSPNVGKTTGDKAQQPERHQGHRQHLHPGRLPHLQPGRRVEGGRRDDAGPARPQPQPVGGHAAGGGLRRATRSSKPFGDRRRESARDYGVQLRGYPVGQHLEYRLGVFAGAARHRGAQRVPRRRPRRVVPVRRRHRVLLRRHLPREQAAVGDLAPASTRRRSTTPSRPTCSSNSRSTRGGTG